MRLIGWIRYHFGFCRMGTYGCWHRPIGEFRLDGFAAPLCARHAAEFLAEIEYEYGKPGVWVPR